MSMAINLRLIKTFHLVNERVDCVLSEEELRLEARNVASKIRSILQSNHLN
jgi:hypothetical protein